MESVDKIRRYIVNNGGVSITFAKNIAAMLREVEREHEEEKHAAASEARLRLLGEIAETHMELPKDSNGKPVHVGDRVQWPVGGSFDVIGVSRDTLFYLEDDFSEHAEWTRASDKRHCAPDTWERIVDDAEELSRRWHTSDMGTDEHGELLDALVARCKALAKEERE